MNGIHEYIMLCNAKNLDPHAFCARKTDFYFYYSKKLLPFKKANQQYDTLYTQYKQHISAQKL